MRFIHNQWYGIMPSTVQVLDKLPGKRQSYPYTGLDRPLGLQEVKAPRIPRQHMKVVMLSALRTGTIYSPPPSRQPWYSLLLQSESTLAPECSQKNKSMKIPMTPSGIDPVTFWLVAKCLNQLHDRLHPQTAKCFWKVLGKLPSDIKITRQTAKFLYS